MKKHWVSRALLLLHLVVGLNALGGGYYGMAGAPEVPVEWLSGSPFRNYFVPSLILLTLVGGSNLLAFFAILFEWAQASFVSRTTGLILLIWIGVQIAIIGYVSWLQPTMAVTGLLMLLLAQHRRMKEIL